MFPNYILLDWNSMLFDRSLSNFRMTSIEHHAITLQNLKLLANFNSAHRPRWGMCCQQFWQKRLSVQLGIHLRQGCLCGDIVHQVWKPWSSGWMIIHTSPLTVTPVTVTLRLQWQFWLFPVGLSISKMMRLELEMPPMCPVLTVKFTNKQLKLH